MNRRTMIDVEDFNRRRSVAALLRSSDSAVEDVSRRPNAPLVAGLVGVLLLSAAAAGNAFVSHRAPDGWLDDGTLVLDRSTGARYVASSRVLRPAPTLTSAMLAGASGKPVLVPHEEVQRAPSGEPLPSDGLPERPPALPAEARGLTACTGGAGSVDVYAAAPAADPADQQGLLVRATGSVGVFLVEGRRRWPVTEAAVLTLGYAPGQVREVPGAWLDLVPRGNPLDVVPAAAVDPAGGVGGVGVNGEVVAAVTSARRYLVSGGTLHPYVNRTSELLAPIAARSIDDAVLAAAPQGDPVGFVDAPSTPPAVPAAEDEAVACVRSSDGQVSVERTVRDDGTRPGTRHDLAPADGPTVAVTWHFRPGEGAMLGPTSLDDPLPPGTELETTRIVVVDDGVGHPVDDLDALRLLGYRRDQTVKLGDGWLSLATRGTALRTT